MEELSVNLTYGQALYDAAKELGKVNVLLEEAKEVREILSSQPGFFMLINDPTIAAEEKKKIIKSVFEGRISKELENFLYVLVDKRRISHFIKIIDQFEKLVYEAEGLGTGTVYTVKELSEEQLMKVEEETGKLLRENVKLTQEIDTSLIGGMKILINGKIIDASIKSRIETMMKELVS